MSAKQNSTETALSVRTYQKPTLKKGPVISNVTAQLAVSSAPASACWVARAAFGETDIRWMLFREWLFTQAPAWVRAVYLQYGERFGSWLKNHDAVRAVVRAMMKPAIAKVLAR